ncbi:MAG TPA: tryptophanase [Candidatus Spyradenecus faecavium]|uniref:Tryptophanase n=1 Tax=Candidatus Spyradenecus faecavium TaxID=2840947 RepID=A0A9D1NMP4_9BACT|nr:tryptophanase [Candidatus Spyradenecus faecavium]
MANVKFYGGKQLPLEMHKVRIVQKLFLPPVEERRRLMNEAGNNTFLLQNKDVFMDMLTDSGVNAMSDLQQSAMLRADDAYAGSETYNRLAAKVRELFHMDYFLPAHQGRAAENVLATAYVKPGDVVPMNFHFTTTKAHITRLGGAVEELIVKEGLAPANDCPFKGNFDIPRLEALIQKVGVEKIPFVRVEAGTNLVGGQPLSLQNMRDVAAVCKKYGIKLILDASLLQDNLWFIKQREAECKDWTIRQILDEIASLYDIIYFSARKLGFARGGGIAIRDKADEVRMKELIPLYEGFLTYGGMSVREMEAIVVGLDETLDEDIISQGPQFIEYMANELHRRGIPVILPAGGLGCHLNASEFLDHVPQAQYPAGALAAALYIAGGVRGMERGTLSEQRNEDGSERFAELELLRLAMPRRVFTLSQVEYAIDRVQWLYDNRRLVGGLTFVEEPSVLRFFFGRLAPVGDWQEKLVAKFRADFGDSL